MPKFKERVLNCLHYFRSCSEASPYFSKRNNYPKLVARVGREFLVVGRQENAKKPISRFFSAGICARLIPPDPRFCPKGP